MNLLILLGYGFLCLAIGYLVRNGSFRELAQNRDFWKVQAADYQSKWLRSDDELSTAEKQLIALRNQSPGRDKTGRFVSRPKCSAINGCE